LVGRAAAAAPRQRKLMSSSRSGSLTSFHLEDEANHACGIKRNESFVITGGLWTWSSVRRYLEDGTMAIFPKLKTGRAAHGCGHYYRDSNDLVQNIWPAIQP